MVARRVGGPARVDLLGARRIFLPIHFDVYCPCAARVDLLAAPLITPS